MPGKESDAGRNAGDSSKAVPERELDTFVWDSSQDSPQEWNRGERGESMRSGSGRSLTSLGSKGDTNSVSESTSGGMEVGKEAKEKKDKSSWVKTIGMRTLRLRKNKDPEKSQSRMSISSALGSLDRPGKKGKKDKHGKGDDSQPQTPGASSTTGAKPGEHVKDSDSIYSGASSKNGSVTREVAGGTTSTNTASAGENADKQDQARFLGEGLLFKGKLIGVLEVSGPRGDRICQEALSELKMAVKAAGEHKQKITIHIALDGLRIRDEKTGDCLYHHQVHKISFIAQDLTDARAFGYIFGSPDTGHRFFGIKTEKSASQVVIAMRDLFQVVFDLKKKEIERAKQQLEMQQKFLATRAAETAPTSKTEPKFSIAETYIEGAGAVGGVASDSNPSAPAEVDLLNLEVELNSLQEGLDNIHTNLVDSVPFRGSTASISSDPMNPMPKLSTGSMASASNASNPTPVSSSAVGDPFGDSFDPFDNSASSSTPTAFSASGASSRFTVKGLTDPTSLNFGASQQPPPPYSSSTTPLTFTSDPFAQIDPFPGPKFHGDGDFFTSDPFESPSGQFSFAYPNDSSVTKISVVERIEECANETTQSNNISNSKFTSEMDKDIAGNKPTSTKERQVDGWVASFEDNFVPESEFNGQGDDLSKVDLDIFTDLDPLGTGRIKPFIDRKDFFQHLKNPPKKNLKDLGASENLTPHSSSSSLVAESSVVNTSGLSAHGSEMTPPKLQLTDTCGVIPNSFSTNFTSSHVNDAVEPFPLKTPPPSVSSRTSSMRMRLHSENSRSESPPNYSPPPPPHTTMHNFSSTSSIGSVGGGGGAAVATNSEYMSTGGQLPFLPPPSSILGTPPSSRFANKKSPQLLKQMTIAGSTANTATSSPRTLPRPSSSGRRERKITAESQSSVGTDDIPNLTPPPRPPHSHTSNTLGKSVSLSTAVPRPSSGSDRLRNLSGMSSLSGVSIASASMAPPEPPPRPLQTTTISSGLAQQMSPSLVSPPPPLPPKKQAFSSMQSSPLSLFQSKQPPLTEFGKSSGVHKIGGGGTTDSSNDLPLPLPSRKPQFSSGSGHHATVGGRYSVPLSSMSPSTHRRDLSGDVESTNKFSASTVNSSSTSGIAGAGISRNPPVVKLTMEQALNQVASMSLGDLAGKLELPVEKLSALTIQQLAEKLTLMDFEQKMEQKERDLNRYSSTSQIQRESHSVSAGGGSGKSSTTTNFQLGFEDDFSTASAPPDIGERSSGQHHHHHHHHHHQSSSSSKKDEYDKYAVFRELSVEEASGFSIIGGLGGSLKASNFSVNSEDDDLSRTMDRTLTNNNSSSERTIQADGTGESMSKNKDTSFATAMQNTMDDITDANLSDDDGKFPFDDDEDISPSSNFNTKPSEWATFESNFDDQFATTSLVKAVDADGNGGSPWDSEDGGENSQKTPPAASALAEAPLSIANTLSESPQRAVPADKFDFEPFQKPSQPAVANYSLAETGSNPAVPPVPERRRPSRENGSLTQQQAGNQPLSPDLLRSPVSQFHRQSSGSSKHSGKSIEEPSIGGGGRGSDYSESGGRTRQRRSSVNEEEGGRWERDRDRDTYSRRRDRDRENYGRSDSRDSYSSIPRGKYRGEGGRGGGESEEEYQPSRSSAGRRRGNNGRPSSSKRSSEREGEAEEDREEEEDTRSYASYHSNYSGTGRKYRRYPPKYHHHYSTGHRKRDRGEKPSTQNPPGSGHSSLSPERYSHHESDFDDSYDEENGGGPRKKDYYARERDYSERHYHRSRPSSGAGYHSGGKRYNRESPRHADPYYRDRYYRGERGRRKYDDEYEDGREYSEYSGEDEHFHGSRHGSHRRRHRCRDDYYRDREHSRHHHYYTNSPSWDSESGPEPGEKSEKGHRPSSGKYGSEHGTTVPRYSPTHGGSSSSRPNSGRRESGSGGGGKPQYPTPQEPHLSGNGHGQYPKRPPSGNGQHGRMREYRFDDDFDGDAFSGRADEREKVGESKKFEDEDRETLNTGKRLSPTIKPETITPIDSKLSQPQSPFEDNFVIPSNSNGGGDEEKGNECKEGIILADILTSEDIDTTSQTTSKRQSQQNQIFFPTKFESEDPGEEESAGLANKSLKGSADKMEGRREAEFEEERENASSPDFAYTPPTSANSLRGNFSVYSTKRLESIRSEEEKSNEDSVSEGALTNNAASNATSSMKKSDSFNIFQAPTQDPFADDDFFK